MAPITLTVPAAEHGKRVDTALASLLRGYTPWRAARFVAAGLVTLDRQLADPDQRVFAGQELRFTLPEPPDRGVDVDDPPPLPVVLHRDAWLLVLNKPAGLVVHPTGGTTTGTLIEAVQADLDSRTRLPGLLRAGIVHRLDAQTSGAIAVACEPAAHRGLVEEFEASRVSKSYLAIVEGVVPRDRLTIKSPIGRARSGSRVLMSTRGDAADRKPAVTHAAVLRRFASHTLVRCVPRTGRNHQIRVHLASAGHPLVGDDFYRAGGRFWPEGGRPDTGLPIDRHALHAERLAFAHPVGGAWLDVTAPPPADFTATLAVLAGGP